MDKKHYVIVSITLGSIALCSALLISLTNLLTKDQIAINEQNKLNNGIKEIYGDNASIKDESDLKDGGYTYVNYMYVIGSEDVTMGYALRTTGYNSYGKMSLIVGFNNACAYIGFYVITNEQSFATDLERDYIIPVQNDERELDDVKCGATFGATLVRNMITEANEVITELDK